MSNNDFDDFDEYENNEIDPIGKVTGLWKKIDEYGKGCLEGSLGGYIKVRVYRNPNKRKPTHPDYNLCFYSVKPEKKHKDEQYE